MGAQLTFESAMEELPELATFCGACLDGGLGRNRQLESPSGVTCPHGHGGAPSIDITELDLTASSDERSAERSDERPAEEEAAALEPDPAFTNWPDPFAPLEELATPRTLEHIYTFDHRTPGTRCDECSLKARRDMTECLSARPEKFNGLMVVGEGPGVDESRLKVPFIGAAGRLLNTLLDQACIEREFTYLTNATLCMPPPSSKKDKKKLLASAVPQCRPRLLAEIAHYQPRVIVALGGAALDSLTGNEVTVTKRTPYNCPTCRNVRVWKAWMCTKCKAVHADVPADATPTAELTPCCEKKWQLRNVKCTDCDGKKTKARTELRWESEFKISEVAGGVFRASTLPIASLLNDPEHTYVIPTYHPSFLLHKAETKGDKQIGGQFLAWASLRHLKKAQRLLTSDPMFDFTWREVVDPEEVRAYTEDTTKHYAIDTETDAKDPLEVTDIRCIAIAHEDRAEVIVIHTSGLPADHPRVQAVRAFLADPKRKKILQNGPYDLPVIARVWETRVEGYVEDTLIAMNACAPDEPHSLEHIVFSFTDSPPWKPPKKTKKEGLKFDSVKKLLEYCGRDTRGTVLGMKALRVEMTKEPYAAPHGVTQVHDLDMKKFRLAINMQERGMPVNRERMLQIGMRAQLKKEEALHTLRTIAGRIPDELVPKGEGANRDAFALNPNSPPQMAWALFSQSGPCKLTPTKWTQPHGQGQPSTEKNALLAYADVPFVDAFFTFKNNQKIKSTWIDGLPIGADMRMHPAWKPIGARTGRWSSSPNFQNWPKWIRAMVEAEEGRVFVGADYDQLELRILAALAGDEEMIRRCRDADGHRKLEPEHDPHSYVASLAFGAGFTELLLKDPAHIVDDKKLIKCACQTCLRKLYRDITKRVVYGLNYGAGAEKIREAIYDGGYDGPAISKEMIERVIVAYFKAFPRVKVWRDAVYAEAMRTRYVRDAFLNRIRCFPLGEVDATVAYNFPIQASAASLVDAATVELHAQLASVDPSAFIFAQVHDAIYVEASKEHAEAIAALMARVLPSEIQVKPGAPWMPLTAEPTIATNWMEAA